MSIAPAPLAPTLEVPTRDPRGLGGLMTLRAGVERPLPLAEVKVRARILGGFAHTVIEQRFENALDQPLEATYRFPLPPAGAVTDLVLRCGDIEVRADLKEKAAAQATFTEAREAGHRAALLTQERDDVHVLSVTRLPAGEAITVRIEVVQALESVDGAWRWRFPTTIAPRYLTGTPTGHSGGGVLPDTDRVPDASRLQPPLRLEGGTRLDLEVSIEGAVAELSSSLHAVKIAFGEALRVAPSAQATLNADFVLAITPGEASALSSQAWTDGHHTLVQIAPPLDGSVAPQARDAVFVVDISGSMGGAKMNAARRALHTALHGLIEGDRFRLIAFDDRLESFAPGFTAYDDRSLAKADRWIDGLAARGGTEMLPAIVEALSETPAADRLQTVLFITDGQAWNEQELLAAVANRRGETRFFTLGIDTAVNEGLLSRMARMGGGTCELATPSDDIEGVVAALEARVGGPLLVGLRPQGAGAAGLGATDVFEGRPASLLIEGAGPVRLTATAPEGYQATLTATPVDFPLGALWARQRVAALQDRLVLKPYEEEALRPEIIAVSLKHRIASTYTAFVAVERGRVVEGDLAHVEQPAELPQGWQAPGTSGFGGGGAPRGQAAPGMAPKSKGMARKRAEARMSAPPPPSLRSRPAPSPAAAPPAPLAEGGLAPMAAAPSPVPAPKAEAPRGGGLMSRLGGLLRGASAPVGGAFDSEDIDEAYAEEAEALAFGGAADLDDLDDAAEGAEVMREAQRPPQSPKAPDGDVVATLARTQGADGSFGGDVGRTAAALVCLALGGHTRRKGSRRRAVQKAARWLARHSDPRAALALLCLDRIEAGDALLGLDLSSLYHAAPEGGWLQISQV